LSTKTIVTGSKFPERAGPVHRVDTLDRNTRRITMGKKTGPEHGARGVTEDMKGKFKEAAGAMTGREDLEKEGEAQQDKAKAERDVAKREAEADKSRAEAKAREAEQRAHQQ